MPLEKRTNENNAHHLNSSHAKSKEYSWKASALKQYMAIHHSRMNEHHCAFQMFPNTGFIPSDGVYHVFIKMASAIV